MSKYASSADEAIERLAACDPTFKGIVVHEYAASATKMARLADCLLKYPNVVKHLELSNTGAGNRAGVKLARYVAHSLSIKFLSLAATNITESTHLAVANALRTNTSLKILYLHSTKQSPSSRIDAAIIDALRVNPCRPRESYWLIYDHGYPLSDFQEKAKQLGAPSMLAQLDFAEKCRAPIKTHLI